MSPKQRTALIALGSVVGGILLVVSAVVVAKDLTKKPKSTKLSANGSTTTTLALGPSDDSGTTTTVPGAVVTTPTTVTVPGGGGGGTVATTATTQQHAVTTTTVVGPVAVSGAPVLQPASATVTTNNIKPCQNLTHYSYAASDARPQCGDVASGADNNFHLFWVIEPDKPASNQGSITGSGTFVSIWGLNQPKGNGDSWQLKLQANFPSSQFKVKAPILTTMVPGSTQLAFGFDNASPPQGVHVDIVQVIGSGAAAAVQVALHVDGQLANAGSSQLDLWTATNHQVIQFVKGAFRIQASNNDPPGPTNL